MRKNLLALAALFAFGFSNAQVSDDVSNEGFSAGDVFITGSVGFSNTKVEDFKTDSFTFSPRAAYFVSDNIALGLAFAYTKTEDDTQMVQNATTMQAGVFGRYYFMPGSRFSLFTQLSLNYLVEDTDFAETNIFEERTVTTTGVNVGFAPGINYFISKRFALEANFGILEYTTAKTDSPDPFSDEVKANNFSVGLDMANINLGLLFKF